MPSNRELFEQAGFWIGPRMFPPEYVDRISAHFDAVLRGEYETGRPPHGVNKFGDSMVKVSNAWWADEVIRDVVMDPRIASVAANLLGVDELYLWADSLYWKAPLKALEQGVIGWHQDRQYWDISSTDNMITAIVNLYEADALSGGMRYAEGSHRWGLVGGSDALVGAENAGSHGTPRAPDGQSWKEIIPSVPSGSVTYHHALTFHGSGPNLSSEPRRSITIHMVAGEGRLTRPFDDPIYAPLTTGDFFRGPLFPRLVSYEDD